PSWSPSYGTSVRAGLVGEEPGAGERSVGGRFVEGAHDQALEVPDARLEERAVHARRQAARTEPTLDARHHPDVLLVRAVERLAAEIAQRRQLAAEIEAPRHQPDALGRDRIDPQVRELVRREHRDEVRKQVPEPDVGVLLVREVRGPRDDLTV